jgi:hypothetical protein
MPDTIELEYDVVMIPIKEGHQEELDRLHAEGWVPANGVTSVAIYHIVRQKAKPPVQDIGGGFGTVSIDESKVIIVRKDGTVDRGYTPGE